MRAILLVLRVYGFTCDVRARLCFVLCVRDFVLRFAFAVLLCVLRASFVMCERDSACVVRTRICLCAFMFCVVCA